MKQLFPFTKNYHLDFHLENMPTRILDIAYAHWKNGDSGIALASLTATTSFIQAKMGQTMHFICVAWSILMKIKLFLAP